MIFATVGTNHARFDRLLEALDAWGGDEELVVQHGPSRVRPRWASEAYDFLSFEASVELVRAARVVVTHAGTGSILVALTHGKRPIVAPRLRRYAEAVDDHQVAFARRLDDAGLVRMIDLTQPTDLAVALRDGGERPTATALESGLVDDLRTYVDGVLAA